MTSESILVTGGAGFIGSHFVRRWIAAKSGPVVNLDKLTYAGNLDSLVEVESENAHIFVHGDIGDQQLVADILAKHRPRAIVNFAAESHVDRSIDGPAAFVETNVVGTVNLLGQSLDHWKGLDRAERDRFRFVHVSTDEVYGSLGPTGHFSESSPYAPNSPYSASKAASDHFVRAFHHTYGLPTVITNCSNNYGPNQFPEKLIPHMILNAVEGKPLPVYGDGQNVRDWLYVGDHCDAIVCALERGSPGEVYNIGGDCERTNLNIVESISDIVDQLRPGLPHAPSRQLITFVKDRPGHDQRYAIDATKIEQELGWRPTQDFESGLKQTIQWYLDNENWVQRVASGKYRRERIGLAQDGR